MIKAYFNYNLPRVYANNGQHIEMCIRFKLTGKFEKADNKSATECADCLGYQIKTAKASCGLGNDIEEVVKQDKASQYIIGLTTGEMYILTKSEYVHFIKNNSYIDTCSPRSRQKANCKIRMKNETKKMRDFLESL